MTPSKVERWNELKAKIATHGLRNSLLIAIAPTATIASIVGSYESIEPMVSNLFKRETLSGEFLQINRYLVQELKEIGLWNDETRAAIKKADGSIQGITTIPANIRAIYRTAWELPMRSLIDMAADRGAYIDQSASLNLFQESPTIGKLSSMYMYAWEKGVKTTYYMRSRPATSINKVSIAGATDAAEVVAKPEQVLVPQADAVPVAQNANLSADQSAAPAATMKAVYTDAEAISCSLENPEACEACS